MSKGLAPVRISAVCHGLTRADITARQHSMVIDEPPVRHGQDTGMIPLEALMVSFAGCTNVIANRIAGEMGIELQDVRIDIRGMLDTRGIEGVEKLEVPFPEIFLNISLKTAASAEQMGKLKDDLRWRCPVSALLRAAGSTITESWDIEYA